MKGFAMMCIGKTAWINKERPIIGPFDALVEPLALAPCTSDIHTVYSGAIGERTNMILGHEAVGRVVEVGSEVRDFKKGDRVVVPAITPEWRTTAIQEGVPAQHSEGMLTGWKFSNIKDGVFGEFFHVNDADMNLAILPESISLEQGLMMCDMMTTGFHGVEMANVQFGSTVAVIGIGPVGLMAVAGAALRGAGRIFAVGSRPTCVKIAKEYGATDIVNYKQGSIVTQILEATKNHGVDHVIIAGGDNSVLGDAVTMLKPGGVIGNINYFGEGDSLPIPRLAWGCGMAHKYIHSGLCPGGRVRMERMIALVKYGRVDPAKMVTHRLSGLEGVEKGLEMMHSKDADVIKPITII
ncbi:NAD(P)-dependent alcohol dehydrogenase [Desulfovibrio litoralis]|uniref:Threonine dehydrogenase n=1 Tax=Desulfovibrio litoralis DSM 11393 TaxID=1121455 RepID=A0A1M7RSS3_9BACT|nr:NAD(P)-dependent alcohol dehydrogenase [Desulfovibrio litoralis]SHN49122.1 Threonine dehydrogenase [Desulfovibrio litoralis DSM 11393]